MRTNACTALALLAWFFALAGVSGAEELKGTWVRDGLSVEALRRRPQSERVLVIRGDDGGLAGRLIAPTLVGLPVSVERRGEELRLSVRMARGMEMALVGSLEGDRLRLAPPAGDGPPALLRKASPEERAALGRLTPEKLPLPRVQALAPNGLARTPPMGWSSWNHFQTGIDDGTIREIADALVATGMRDAGYVHVNIDDGWQGRRDEKGEIHPNDKFPDMKALADYLHARGLKLGIYTSPGPRSCAGFEGSYGHEEQDARTFARWGVDYVKYDWCSAGLIYDDDEMPAVYQKMAEALRAAGRPMVFSICQYGRAEVWKWGADAGGNLWRTTGDIADHWQVMSAIGFGQDELAPFAGPGRWNDPDMLEVGNGKMGPAEYRTHMSLWALLAAPLIAGHDVRRSSPEAIALLANGELIAIDQDALGRSGRRIARRGPHEVWARPLEGGRTAVGLFNRGEEAAKIDASFSEIGVRGRARARDVWAKRSLGVAQGAVSARVEPHGVALLVLEPLAAEEPEGKAEDEGGRG